MNNLANFIIYPTDTSNHVKIRIRNEAIGDYGDYFSIQINVLSDDIRKSQKIGSKRFNSNENLGHYNKSIPNLPTMDMQLHFPLNIYKIR